MSHPLITGDGQPVTLFVGGITQNEADLRIFGSGVTGTKIFQPIVDLEASQLGDHVANLAREHRVTAAVGVSFGAQVVASLAADLQQHTRLCLVFPTLADAPRDATSRHTLTTLADALRNHDQVAIVNALLSLQPVSARQRITAKVWARRQADWLATTGASRLIDELAAAQPESAGAVTGAPLATRVWQAITASSLIVAQRDDPIHPVSVAARIAELIPQSQLVIGDTAWVWSARDQLREVIAGYLDLP